MFESYSGKNSVLKWCVKWMIGNAGVGYIYRSWPVLLGVWLICLLKFGKELIGLACNLGQVFFAFPPFPAACASLESHVTITPFSAFCKAPPLHFVVPFKQLESHTDDKLSSFGVQKLGNMIARLHPNLILQSLLEAVPAWGCLLVAFCVWTGKKG